MIIRKDDLEAAVEHGVISAKSARDLSEFTIKRAAVPRAVNEHFKLVNNFSEIFICIGLFIVYGAFSTFIEGGLLGSKFLPVGAIGFWLMAEFFAFRTNKMLPTLVAALMSCSFAVHSVLYFTGMNPQEISDFSGKNSPLIWAGIALSLAIAFVRFRIPILLALIAASTTLAALLFSGTSVGNATFLWPLGICGVSVLALAFWFDSRDPLRRSRQNAYAFWLFIIGSPLAIHPVFASVWLNGDKSDPGSVIAIVFVLAIITSLIGLILDRRTLVASSLIYFTIGIGYSYFSVTKDVTSALATTSLLVGFFVILLGVLWYRARRIVLALLPFPRLKALIPPSN